MVDPKAIEYKNAYDTLRRTVGKNNFPFLVESSKGRYELKSEVVLAGSGQLGIRPTK